MTIDSVRLRWMLTRTLVQTGMVDVAHRSQLGLSVAFPGRASSQIIFPNSLQNNGISLLGRSSPPIKGTREGRVRLTVKVSTFDVVNL